MNERDHCLVVDCIGFDDVLMIVISMMAMTFRSSDIMGDGCRFGDDASALGDLSRSTGRR